MLLILTVGFQQSYLRGVVTVTEVRVATHVDSVIVTLVVNFHDWEWSQPSWPHLLVDIW